MTGGSIQDECGNLDLAISEVIQRAVDSGIQRYIQSRKARVPGFVTKHFSLRGALKLHRKALGKDLYKAPLNLIWLLPLTLIKASSFLLNKVGAASVARRFNRLPGGFQTDVQKEVTWLIYTELLELPYQQDSRVSAKDALLEAILEDVQLSALIQAYLREIQQKVGRQDFRQALEKNLQAYANSRSAAAELAGNIVALCTSYAAFHQAMPGALSVGSATASAIAQQLAISQFWLGPTLGAWYYAVFPAAASTGLVVATTGAIMAGLGLIATFSGIVTDPLQAKLGLHQRRLSKFIDALAAQIEGKQEGYSIEEVYVSRVFDILDLLMLAMRS